MLLVDYGPTKSTCYSLIMLLVNYGRTKNSYISAITAHIKHTLPGTPWITRARTAYRILVVKPKASEAKDASKLEQMNTYFLLN